MKRVLIFGGTHGNEWTGVTVVQKYQEYFAQKFPHLDLHFIFANPEAYYINKRFKDEDLNRAFQDLNETRASYENQRARELKKLIEIETCFVIDLHSTTSNMGQTVILTHYNSTNLSVASALAKALPKCRIIGSPDPQRKYLASQSNFGLMVEVGPVANGTIKAEALHETLDVIENILNSLSRPLPILQGELEFYEEIEDVFYPVNDKGEITAFIHEEFQGKDFQKLHGKYKPFESFSGETITRVAQDPLFPIFINEAAYYPSKLAYTLCRKKILDLDSTHHFESV